MSDSEIAADLSDLTKALADDNDRQMSAAELNRKMLDAIDRKDLRALAELMHIQACRIADEEQEGYQE